MTSNEARLLVVACSAALLVTASSARADLTPVEHEEARAHLRQGNELRASGDLRGALAKYRAPHAIAGTLITGLEVGRTHLLLGELVEALAALEAVAGIPKKPNESSNTSAARAEAARLAAEITPRIPTLV